MDYQRHYDLLIGRSKHRVLAAYTERHHIIPRCLGGGDSAANIVCLLPEEHYLAHLLLVKMHPNNHKLVRAAMMMSGKGSRFLHRSNKFYGWLRRKHSEWMKTRVVSSESIEKGAAKNRLKVRTTEFKEAVRAYHKGRKRPVETGRKISDSHKIRCRTPQFRARMSLLNKGRKRSKEFCAKMAVANKGKRHSAETKAKMRDAKLGKLKSPETRQRMSAAQKLRRAACNQKPSAQNT